MQGKVAHYVFVASAGAYKGNKMEPALVEGDPRKGSAGHVEVEKYLESEVSLPSLPGKILAGHACIPHSSHGSAAFQDPPMSLGRGLLQSSAGEYPLTWMDPEFHPSIHKIDGCCHVPCLGIWC